MPQQICQVVCVWGGGGGGESCIFVNNCVFDEMISFLQLYLETEQKQVGTFLIAAMLYLIMCKCFFFFGGGGGGGGGGGAKCVFKIV